MRMTENKPTILTIKDGSLDNFALFSIESFGQDKVQLVIGAPYEHRRSSLFSKDSLSALIAELLAVHDAM